MQQNTGCFMAPRAYTNGPHIYIPVVNFVRVPRDVYQESVQRAQKNGNRTVSEGGNAHAIAAGAGPFDAS
jgi:hypothetical protein